MVENKVILTIDKRAVIGFLKMFEWTDGQALPEDVELLDAKLEFYSDDVLFKISHPSFPKHVEGSELVRWTPTSPCPSFFLKAISEEMAKAVAEFIVDNMTKDETIYKLIDGRYS